MEIDLLLVSHNQCVLQYSQHPFHLILFARFSKSCTAIISTNNCLSCLCASSTAALIEASSATPKIVTTSAPNLIAWLTS